MPLGAQPAALAPFPTQAAPALISEAALPNNGRPDQAGLLSHVTTRGQTPGHNMTSAATEELEGRPPYLHVRRDAASPGEKEGVRVLRTVC